MICKTCKQDKSDEEFYWKKDGKVHNYDCRICYRQKVRENPERPEKRRENHLWYNYGITVEQYNEMLEKQEGKCAICGELPRLEGMASTPMLQVDHDHQTGRVRGLLCLRCNTGISNFGHDWNRVVKALDYINFHEHGWKREQ